MSNINISPHDKRMLARGPKIVAIGGGTGLSTMLRGIKSYTSNITAIVTVADDGGGSGVLRNDLGMLPPGDIRNCIISLSEAEPIILELLQYRFKEGMLSGQSFGNLFLAAMDGISDNFLEAVLNMANILSVTGLVLPVTLKDIILCARLSDGYEIEGESNIGNHNKDHPGKIENVYLKPGDVSATEGVTEAILEADAILFGPGSLYTSVIPNLLVKGVKEAIKKSRAIKIYICNVMTQPGETEGYMVSDHIEALEKHSFKGIVKNCIINTESIPENILQRYIEDGVGTVVVDFDNLTKKGINVIRGKFVDISNGYVRHGSKRLAGKIFEMLAQEVMANNPKKELDYLYLLDRIQKLKSESKFSR